VSTLTKNPAQDHFRLTLIDGFAGGGLYLDDRTKEERSGSPLIMLEAMQRAGEMAQEKRSKTFNLDVQYIFIEKDPLALNYLRDVLAKSEYSHLVRDGKIELIEGEFTKQVPKITKFVKARGRAGRAIFVLDQFGYSDVPLPTVQNILATLDNAEIILTFATDFLIDYLSENELTQQMLENVGISLPSKTISTAKEKSDWRRTIQFALHDQIPSKTGARYYTPFFIRSEDSHRDFWLIHLSGHFKARDVMVGLHWKENTSFAHYGKPGLRMLGYDQKNDPDWSEQLLLPQFSFDQDAFESSHEELLEQLPEKISAFPDGIPFKDLFANLTNECPVTAEMMKGVLADLARHGIIKVQDEKGLTTRQKGLLPDKRASRMEMISSFHLLKSIFLFLELYCGRSATFPAPHVTAQQSPRPNSLCLAVTTSRPYRHQSLASARTPH